MVPEGIEQQALQILIAFAQQYRSELLAIRKYEESELWKVRILFNELAAEAEYFSKLKNNQDVFS